MGYMDMGEIVDAWVKHFNAKDFEKLFSLYEVDAIQYEASTNQTKIGRSHILNRYRTLANASGDYKAEIKTICVAQKRVVFTIRLSGTNTAPLLGHKPTYKHFDFQTCIILESANGKIIRHTTFLDMATVFRAIGMTDFPRWYEVAA